MQFFSLCRSVFPGSRTCGSWLKRYSSLGAAGIIKVTKAGTTTITTARRRRCVRGPVEPLPCVTACTPAGLLTAPTATLVLSLLSRAWTTPGRSCTRTQSVQRSQVQRTITSEPVRAWITTRPLVLGQRGTTEERRDL